MSEDNPQKMISPKRSEAEEAVRTLLRWAGDDPTRGELFLVEGDGEGEVVPGEHLRAAVNQCFVQIQHQRGIGRVPRLAR